MTGGMVSCGIQMFDIGVRRCGYRASGSGINGTWPCELGLQKARGHSTSLSAPLLPRPSAFVQHSLAWPCL